MANTNKPNLRGLDRWVRVKVILPFGALLGIGFVYFLLFFDIHLRIFLEDIGSKINGAQVTISSVKTSLLRCEFELKGLEIAHHVHPMKNLFEVDRISFKFLFAPLLAKKLIIKDFIVEGIHYRTDRKSSGIIHLGSEDFSPAMGLIDRVAPGFYSELRQEIDENPLRNLSYLLTGIDITNELRKSMHELGAMTKLNQLKERFMTSSKQREQIRLEIPKPGILHEYQRQIEQFSQLRSPAESHQAIAKLRQTLKEQSEKLKTASENAKKDSEEFYIALKDVESSVELDIEKLRSKLRLPRLDFDDISPLLFGPKLLNYLERVTYWVDLSRRRMPKGSRKGQLTVVAQQRTKGTSFHFGKMAAFPAFLIYQGFIHSDHSPLSRQGKVRGTLVGLTSDPPIYGKPTQLSVDAHFPESQIEGAHGEIEIDHTGDGLHEAFHLSVDSLPIEDWNLNDTSDLRFGISKARAKVSLDASFQDDLVKASLNVTLENVEYVVSSRFKKLEDTIRDIVNSTDFFELQVRVDGQLDKLKLRAQSELGQRLASGLKKEFTVQIAAIGDTIRARLLDEIDLPKHDLLTKFRELEDKTFAPLQVTTKKVQELENSADQVIARLEMGNKHAVHQQ